MTSLWKGGEGKGPEELCIVKRAIAIGACFEDTTPMDRPLFATSCQKAAMDGWWARFHASKSAGHAIPWEARDTTM